MSAEMYDDAKEFFRHSSMTNSIDEVIESSAPLKIGVDLDNREVLIGVHDKMYFMNMEMAGQALHALFLAVRTLEATIALENN